MSLDPNIGMMRLVANIAKLCFSYGWGKLLLIGFTHSGGLWCE